MSRSMLVLVATINAALWIGNQRAFRFLPRKVEPRPPRGAVGAGDGSNRRETGCGEAGRFVYSNHSGSGVLPCCCCCIAAVDVWLSYFQPAKERRSCNGPQRRSQEITLTKVTI